MSTRTIVEINHDYLHDLEHHPERWGELVRGLKTLEYNRALNDGETPTAISGVRVLGQRHHSERLKLEVR